MDTIIGGKEARLVSAYAHADSQADRRPFPEVITVTTTGSFTLKSDPKIRYRKKGL